MITERLYYADSHMRDFSATVLECRELKEGWGLVLDRTAFFPEGGGQLADTGNIGAAAISDVQEWEEEILHFASQPLREGESYTCSIDWDKRFSRMQNHSGEHIVSGLAHRLYGCENVGFHMGDVITIDFDRELSWQQLMEIEALANEAVWQDMPIHCAFPSAPELEKLNYRSKIELGGDVRIVTVPGIDCCACCAPHVKHTGEIGQIKILSAQRHRSGVRLELCCGRLALENARIIQANVTAVSQALSVKRHESAAAVSRILSEQQKSKERIAQLSMALVQLRAEAIEKNQGNITVFDDILDEVAQRELVNLLMEKCTGIAALFSGSDEAGYRYIMGSLSLDMGKLARTINPLINGRGGGRGSMIQGSCKARRKEIEAALSQRFAG